MLKCHRPKPSFCRQIMLSLKIGVQTISLAKSLKRALTIAAQMKADAVEIDARHELRAEVQSQTAIRQFRKMLDDLNLRLAALAFPTRRGYDNPEMLDRRVAATKEALRLASELGAGVVVNRVGQVPSASELKEEDDEASGRWNSLCEVLSDLGQFGDRQGAILTAETGDESGEDLAHLLRSLSGGSIGVALNPGNLILADFSPLEAIAQLGSRIRYVRARDAVRQGRSQRGSEVALGRGSIDPPALLAALEEHDYCGMITIERRESHDPLLEIGQAITYLRNL